MSRIDPGGRAGRAVVMPGWLVAIPVLATAAIVGLALFVGPGEPSPTPAREVRLDRGSYACPGGLSTVAGQIAPGTRATAQSLPAVRSGESTPGRATDVKDLSDATTWRTATTPAGSTVVAQVGRGTGAVGFVSGQGSKSDGGGLSVAGCPGVVDDAWFTGLGSGAKHQSTLLLTNTADTPAAATVDLWNPKGVVDAIDSEGIVVPAGSTRRIRLADLAAGEKQLSAHVVRLRGALTIAALDTSTAVFRGTEISSAGAGLARDQWLAGLPSGAKGRTLQVVNPSQKTARLSITAFGPKGRFVPKGLTDVKVGAGRMREITLPSSVGSDAVTLHVTSDVAVAASVRISPDTVDFARVQSVAALDGTAAVPLGLEATQGAPSLMLSGIGRRSARVQLTAYDQNMKKLDAASVTLESGRTRTVALSKSLKLSGAAVVLVKAAGDAVGTALYRSGGRIASLPLIAAPVTALGPDVTIVGP